MIDNGECYQRPDGDSIYLAGADAEVELEH